MLQRVQAVVALQVKVLALPLTSVNVCNFVPVEPFHR